MTREREGWCAIYSLVGVPKLERDFDESPCRLQFLCIISWHCTVYYTRCGLHEKETREPCIIVWTWPYYWNERTSKRVTESSCRITTNVHTMNKKETIFLLQYVGLLQCRLWQQDEKTVDYASTHEAVRRISDLAVFFFTYSTFLGGRIWRPKSLRFSHASIE